MRQRACKPGSVRLASGKRDCAAIPLGGGLPRRSSNQPGRRAGTRLMRRPYSVLHPVGFTVPTLLPGPRCALAAPFRPYPAEARRNTFCGTIPDFPREAAGRYPAPWFHGARTFLVEASFPAAARPSGRAPYKRTIPPVPVSVVRLLNRSPSNSLCAAEGLSVGTEEQQRHIPRGRFT